MQESTLCAAIRSDESLKTWKLVHTEFVRSSHVTFSQQRKMAIALTCTTNKDALLMYELLLGYSRYSTVQFYRVCMVC